MTRNRQKQKHYWYLFAAVAFAILHGCVVVPIPTPQKEKPFNEGQIGFIETNKTTKDDVIVRIGSPSAVRKDGALFLYQTDAKVGSLLWGWVIPSAPIAVGDAGSEEIWKWFYLLVEFNADDTVKAVESLSGPNPRSQSGFFIDEDFILEEQRQTRKLILYDTSEEDAVAKRFESPAEGTVIYAYWDKGLKGLDSNGYISLDGQLSEYANEDGFFRWEIQPGNHQVRAHREMYRGTINKFLNLRCEEGQIYFIRLKRFARGVIEVSVVDHNESCRKISKRKLILL